MNKREGTPESGFRSNTNVAIHVPDLARAEEFYGRVLGFHLVERSDDKLEFDTGALRLFVNRDTEVLAFIPALEVDDIDRAREHLEAAGRRVSREWPEYQAFYFEDPFGIPLNVIQT